MRNEKPIINVTSGVAFQQQDGPLRFQVEWCTLDDYLGVAREGWGRSNDFIRALNKVSSDFMNFNEEKFGNIYKRKRDLENRMCGIQSELERVDSHN